MRNIKPVFLTLLVSLCLSACGSENMEAGADTEKTPAFDWKSSGFAISEEISQEQELWVASYENWIPLEGVKGENILDIRDSIGVRGDSFYRYYQEFEDISPEGDVRELSKSSFVLEQYHLKDNTLTVTNFTREQMGLAEAQNAQGANMDVLSDGTYVFHTIELVPNEQDEFTRRDRMTYFDGTNVQTVDLTDAYLERKLIEKSYPLMMLSGECIADAEGNTYIRGQGKYLDFGTLYAFDRNGECILSYTAGESEQIGEPFRTSKGDLIFPIDGDTLRLVWFDTQAGGSPKLLAEMPRSYGTRFFGLWGEELYYQQDADVVKWNIRTGEQNIVINLQQACINNAYHTELGILSKSEKLLHAYGQIDEEDEDLLIRLSEEPVETGSPLRVVTLLDTVPLKVSDSAYLAGKTNKAMTFTYAGVSKEMKNYRTSVMAELAAGNGEDVLYVSREDMERMQKQGYLMDLTTLLTQEELDTILPGVLALGTVDDTLVGIPPQIFATTMVIGSSAWKQDGWTLEQLIELMDTAKLDSRMLADYTVYFAPRATLRVTLKYAYADSFLIDWDKRESHFEDERFITLLECIGTGTEPTETETDNEWQNGNHIFPTLFNSDMLLLNGMLDKFIDGGHYVGHPSDSGVGNYIDTDGVLVVNANTKNPEAVKAYLQTLLSPEIQEDLRWISGLQITKVNPADAKTAEDGKLYWHNMEVAVYDDGTNSLELAMDFLEKCRPAPCRFEEIDRIVLEEAEAYFAGQSSAAHVAEVIDNRVQLYLDEE